MTGHAGLRDAHMGMLDTDMDLFTDYPARVAAVIKEAMDSTKITMNGLAERTDRQVARETIRRKLTGMPPGFTVSELALIAPHIGMTVSEIHLAAEARSAA